MTPGISTCHDAFFSKYPLKFHSLPYFLINSPPAWTFSGISAKSNQRKQLHWDQACLLELHVTECAWSMLLHITTCTYSVFGLLRGRIHPTCHEKRQFDVSFSYPPSHPRNVKRGNENYKFYWNKKTLKVVFMFCLERKNINGT